MPLPAADTSSGTLSSLQILRGAAAWLVVYHHYMQGFHNFNYDTPAGHFFTVVGRFGIDIFFVISGFIMHYTLTRRQYSAREFLLRRVLRIVPLYWFMTLAFIPILYIFPSTFASLFGWDLSSLALSLLFIPHPNPSGLGKFPLLTVGWTLNFEMFFYLWLGMMLWVFRQRWFAACTVSLLLLPSLWNKSWPYGSILSSNLLYEFAIGMLVSHLFLHPRWRQPWRRPFVGWLFLLLGAGVYWTGFAKPAPLNFTETPFLSRLDNVTPQLAAALFVCAALAFEQQTFRLPALRLFRYLGDISYSTYLVHPLALCIAVYLIGRPHSLIGEMLALGAYTILSLALSHLSYRWIETGPAMGFLKRSLLAPRPATEPAEAHVP